MSQPSPSRHSHASAPGTSAYDSDEIDLFELMQVLWKGRRLIIALFVVGIIGAGISLVANTKEQTWTSSARVSAPGMAHVHDLLSSLRHVESITRDQFTTHNGLASALFDEFIIQVYSPDNQAGFLSGYQSASGVLRGGFTLVDARRQDIHPFYTISLTGVDPAITQQVITDYLEFVNRIVVDGFYKDLEDQVATYSRALKAEQSALERRTATEPESSLGAIVGLQGPALPDRYHEIAGQLDVLQSWESGAQGEVRAYRYQLEPRSSASGTRNAKLILALGGILGLMAGVFAVVIVNAFQNRQRATASSSES